MKGTQSALLPDAAGIAKVQHVGCVLYEELGSIHRELRILIQSILWSAIATDQSVEFRSRQVARKLTHRRELIQSQSLILSNHLVRQNISESDWQNWNAKGKRVADLLMYPPCLDRFRRYYRQKYVRKSDEAFYLLREILSLTQVSVPHRLEPVSPHCLVNSGCNS